MWPITPTIWSQCNISYASPWVEWLVYCFSRHARDLGINGIRFDTVIPWDNGSENPYLGETWVADDGKTYGSQNLFRQREFLKRLYRVFHGGEVKDGALYHPVAGPPIMAVESFEDVHEIGEGDFQNLPTLKQGYPQDQVRVRMTGKAYGFLTASNLKSGWSLTPNKRVGALLAAGADPRLTMRPKSCVLNHDGKTIEVGPKIWQGWSWVNRGTAQWWPHWRNQKMVTVSGKGEHYASFYLQPGKRILLVATNYELEPQEVTIALNREALGFVKEVKLEAQNAITEEAVDIGSEENPILKLTLEPELYQLLKIGPRTELDGPNLDPDPRHQNERFKSSLKKNS